MHTHFFPLVYRTLLLLVTVILTAVSIIYDTQAKPQTNVKALNKLDSNLKLAAGHTDSTLNTSRLTLQSITSPDQRTVRVQVRLNQVYPSVFRDLQVAGLQIDAQYGGLVTGKISPTQLLELAEIPEVSSVHPLLKAFTRSVIGEGVPALRADIVHRSVPGFDGSGIKIGIISDSFALVSTATPTLADVDGDGILEVTGTDSQLAGELPEFVEILKEGVFETEEERLQYVDEGRAMAEIVHEIAPGAEIAFYTGVDSPADFASGIIALANAGCAIIVDDIAWSNGTVYQDGEISQAIKQAAEEYDVAYFTATGNDSYGSIQSHFFDVNPDKDDGFNTKFPNGNNFHKWPYINSPALPVTLKPHTEFLMILQWEDPLNGMMGSGASTDYDLFVTEKKNISISTTIAVSDNYQGFPEEPAGLPFEYVKMRNDTDKEKTLFVFINKHHGPDASFKLYSFGRNKAIYPSWVRTQDNDFLYGHTMSNYAISVAAVHAMEVLTEGKFESRPDRIDPAWYSTRGGPFSILFSPDGSRHSMPELRYKPDIASIAGVNTSFFHTDAAYDEDDLPNFLGTSAAAPHAAAICALMRQANPSLNAAELRHIIRAAATDIFEEGRDPYTGMGLLYADNAVKAAINQPPSEEKPSIPLNSVIVTDNLHSIQDLSNSKDYDEESNRSLAVQWYIDQEIIDIHIYVSVDNGPMTYLGRTASSVSNAFEWKAGQQHLNPLFVGGPKFGHSYKFCVFGLRADQPFVGPYDTVGEVSFLEFITQKP